MAILALVCLCCGPASALSETPGQPHVFSTLFTAQDVREHLSTDDGTSAAIDWCKKTSVTKVYI